MARKVVWSHESAEDLAAVAEYIARDSSFYAASFVQEIIEASRSLNMLAERGRVVPEIGSSEIRELFVKEYRLIYKVEETRVVILGIIHGKRNFNSF